jgi:hypothetical protein
MPLTNFPKPSWQGNLHRPRSCFSGALPSLDRQVLFREFIKGCGVKQILKQILKQYQQSFVIPFRMM